MTINHDDFQQFGGPVKSWSPEELCDRMAVSQLVKIYALGVDMRDTALAMSVFAPDAISEGNLGAAAASEMIPKACEGAAVYMGTQHNVTNQHITVEGDEALVWSYAVALHFWDPSSGKKNLYMGIQYRDRCRRFPDGWKIVHRKVANMWREGPFPHEA